MERKKSLAYTVGGLCFISLLFSCNSSTSSQIGVHGTERYSINPEANTEGLKNTQYSIDSICSLHMPDDIVDIGIDKYIFSQKIEEIIHQSIINRITRHIEKQCCAHNKEMARLVQSEEGVIISVNSSLHVLLLLLIYSSFFC